MEVWRFVFVLVLNLILEATGGLNEPKNRRVCVIGAGYAGLAAARYLQEYGVKYTVFEASRHVGGTWRFDPHVGIDEDGLPVFTSMYKYLRTNTPRQTMEFTGFPFPEGTPSYPSGDCFHKYLRLFTNKFDLKKNIQFRSWVQSVKWANHRWNVTYTKTDTRDNITEACDFVFVATGELNMPVLPKFARQEEFRGKIIHSHDYKDPEPYRNRRVLVVGAGPSGLDMAVHLHNVASKLIHSHHLKYNQPDFGQNYVKKPDIKEFTANGVMFLDGSFEEIDQAIICTGYDYDHPFLDESVGITRSGKFMLPLYRHSVNIRHPTMMFIGVAKKIINRVIDVQAAFAAHIAAGKVQLPSQEAMLASWLQHVRSLRDRRLKIVDVNVIGDQMDEYFGNITSEAGVARAPPVLKEIRDFNAKNRLEDLLNYRDYDYRITDNTHYDRWYNKREGFPCPIDEQDLE